MAYRLEYCPGCAEKLSEERGSNIPRYHVQSDDDLESLFVDALVFDVPFIVQQRTCKNQECKKPWWGVELDYYKMKEVLSELKKVREERDALREEVAKLRKELDALKN